MRKSEMETAIINGIKALVEEHNEHDKIQREWVERERASGTDEEFFKDLFYFNEYIYSSELINIISSVVFGHDAEEHIEYNRRFNGVPRGRNYRNILTDEERIKVNKIVRGMIDRNIIKISKSKKMVKLL